LTFFFEFIIGQHVYRVENNTPDTETIWWTPSPTWCSFRVRLYDDPTISIILS